MKFQQVVPKEKWSAEKTQERIDSVWREIKELNHEQNKIDSQINALKDRKRVIGIKIGNKNKYLNQLEVQKKNIGWEEL